MGLPALASFSCLNSCFLFRNLSVLHSLQQICRTCNCLIIDSDPLCSSKRGPRVPEALPRSVEAEAFDEELETASREMKSHALSSVLTKGTRLTDPLCSSKVPNLVGVALMFLKHCQGQWRLHLSS